MKLTHARLLVEDYGACYRFYRDSDWAIRIAYVRDPGGSLIELNQPIPEEE